MKVGELIERLGKFPLSAEVNMSISFTRDTAEDEGLAWAPLVHLAAIGYGHGQEVVLLSGAEDSGVADVEGSG